MMDYIYGLVTVMVIADMLDRHVPEAFVENVLTVMPF